jgi:hypothetical protein
MGWDEKGRGFEVKVDADGTAHLTDEAYEFIVDKVYERIRKSRSWVTSESQLVEQLSRTSALPRAERERIARAIADLELGVE